MEARAGLWGQTRTDLLLSHSSNPTVAPYSICDHDLISEPITDSSSSTMLSQNHSAISVV